MCFSPGSTWIPVVVGTPSFFQVVCEPWKWTVCGRIPFELSRVTSMSLPSVVRRIGPGTLAGPSSALNAQTCGSSIGPPIVSLGWTACLHCSVPSVTFPPCSSTWTTSGGEVYGSLPSLPLTFAGGSPSVGFVDCWPPAVQPASTAVPTPPLAARNSRREMPVPGAPIRSVMIQLQLRTGVE